MLRWVVPFAARGSFMLVTLQDAVTGSSAAVFLDIERDAPMSSVFASFVSVMGADVSGADRGLTVDGTVVGPATPIQAAALREGSVITLLGASSKPTGSLRAVQSTAQVRVVAGLDAGRVLHAGSGLILIGQGAAADIRVVDAAAADVDLAIIIAADGTAEVQPVGERSAATIGGEPITARRALPITEQIVYADRIIEVGHVDHTRAALEPNDAAGTLRYNRPPRILPPEAESDFRLPGEPREPDRPPLPILMSMLPLMMSIVMVLVFKNPMMLAFGLMSPVMLLGSFFSGKRNSRKRYRRQMVEYREAKAQIEADAQAALVTEGVQRRRDAPDPTEVAQIAIGPSPRLWERRTSDDTYLRLRMGTATQQSRVTLNDPEQLAHKQHIVWDMRDAAATVSLPEVGVVGVTTSDGVPDRARRVAQWMCAQVGVLHSPKDVQLYLLEGYAEPDTRGAHPSWEFVSWLPHAVPVDGQDTLRTIATTTTTLAARIAELIAMIENRSVIRRTEGKTAFVGASIVVVLDGASRLRPMPGIVRILKEGPAVGVFAICVERDERLLPEECDTVVVIGDQHATLRRQKTAATEELMLDEVSQSWLDWVSRAIAPVVDISPSVSDAAIPAASRLLDVLQLDPPAPDAIQARWLLNPRSTRASIGESLDGAFSLDLVLDGPHGLIGGTTGSGKSEFLQTIVASFAVANTPEQMNFVLIDYKGGAAFKDCEFLPHTVGMVTDLDTHLVERALDSLSAELRYREHVLADAGAKDLEDYQDLAARRGLPPLARLVVVADEFASLIRELPDFVSGLVNLAQRGRSLGIHLILATQRPGGSVSPEIRANTNLRIALRMTDGAESADVIDAPDAGAISKSTPGRAFARLGANSLVPFQSSRVGGRAPVPDDADAEPSPPLVVPVPFAELGSPAPRRKAVDRGVGDVEITDLKLLVAAVQRASDEMGFGVQRKPWLAALAETVSMEEVDAIAGPRTNPDEIRFGIEDHPAEQAQRAATLTLDDYGHLFVVGASRSGKTTTLRTMIVDASEHMSTADLHVYIIDCGNGGLLPLRGYPHVGAVALRHQTDQVIRLLRKVRALVAERQTALAAAGVSDLTELRRLTSGEDRPAHVLVLLDSWDTFSTTFESVNGGELLDAITFLLREGASVGVHLVITGDRHLLTSGKMSTLADNKIVLRLVEKSDYTFAGIKPKSLPETIGDGRAFVAGDATEVQIAMSDPQLTPQEQSQAIAARGADLLQRDRDVPKRSRPFSIAEMPTALTVEAAVAQYGAVEPDGQILLGVGGEDVEPMFIDPRQAASFVVAGPAGSGRSTVLLALALGALRQGHELVVLAPRSSPLRSLDGREGVKAVFTGTDVTQADIEPLITRGTVIVADDADLLREIEADQYLRTVIPQATDNGVFFLLAGDPDGLSRGFSGWIIEARKARRGVILKPREPLDGDAVGVRISRSDVTAAQEHPAGRGFTQGEGGATVLVQTARTPVSEES